MDLRRQGVKNLRATLISTLIMCVIVFSILLLFHLNENYGFHPIDYLLMLMDKDLVQPASNNLAQKYSQDNLTDAGNQRPHYIIESVLNEKTATIDGYMTVLTALPHSETLVFNHYPSYITNNLTVHSVSINDIAIPYTVENDQLLIPIDEFLQTNAEKSAVNVGIAFSTKVPRSGTRFGVKDDIWLLTTWYPILNVVDGNGEWNPRPKPMGFGDPFYFEHADYDVYFTAPEAIHWVTSGSNAGQLSLENNLVQHHWQESMIRNFALVGSDRYTVYEFPTDDNVTLQIALTSDKHLDEVQKILEYSYPLFKDVFGALPYQTLSIAETSWHTNFALEYPNLAIYSMDLYEQGLLERWLPHEFAHSWWYNAVGNHEVTEGWIDEGLVEHAVVLYLENRYGKERAQVQRDYFRNRNLSLISQYPAMTMNMTLENFPNRTVFFDLWYSRSADMFLTLREQLGDIKYTFFLRHLFESNEGEMIDIHTLNRSLKETVKGDHTYFDDWVHRSLSETPFRLTVTPMPVKLNGHHLAPENVRYVDWELYIQAQTLQTILFSKLDNPLHIDPDNGQIYFNGEPVFCPPAYQDDDGTWYIPIEMIKYISECQFSPDVERNLLTVNVYYFNS